MKTPLKEVLAVNNITAIEMSLGIGKYDKYITKRLSKRSNLEFFEEDKVAIAGALGMRVSEINFNKCEPTVNNFKKLHSAAAENIKLKKQLVEMEAQLHEMEATVRKQGTLAFDSGRIAAENERLKDTVYQLNQDKNKLEYDYSIAAKENSKTVYEWIKVKDELARRNKLIEELQERSFIKRVFKVGAK